MMTTPFIPESPSASQVLTPGSQISTDSATTKFSFAGISAASLDMGNMPDYGEQEEEKKEQRLEHSDRAQSETSETNLALIREQFRKKEV